MSNMGIKIITTVLTLMMGHSALADINVRYLCQLNKGRATGPAQWTNEVIVVESMEKNGLSSQTDPDALTTFRRNFLGTRTHMDFKMIRYKDVSLEEYQTNPYEALNNLTRDQMVGEPIVNDNPSLVLAGDVHFLYTVKDRKNREKRAQFIIKSIRLDLLVNKIFPPGEYFLHEKAELFFCHEPDFFETQVVQDDPQLENSSAE